MGGDEESLRSKNHRGTTGTTPPVLVHKSQKIIPSLHRFLHRSSHHIVGVMVTLLHFLRGMIYGLIALSILLFLDQCNVMRMKSSHALRSSVLKSLSLSKGNSNGLASMEASSGLKFIDVDQYKFWMYELDDAPKKIQIAEVELEQAKRNQMAIERDLVPLTEEYAKLMANLQVNLVQFCSECSWHGSTTCDSRVEYLMDAYKDSEVKAKVVLMKNTPSCNRQNSEASV